MDERIAFNEIIEVDDRIIFSSIEGEGLYFLEKNREEATLFVNFPNILFPQRAPYKIMQRIENKIIFPPCMAEEIAVYDWKTKKFNMIELDIVPNNLKNLCKFRTSIIHNDFVYLIGHYYPAIIKMNVYTMDVFYLTDWVQEIEKKRKLGNQPYLGIGIIQENVAKFPCCCTNLILELDLDTDRAKIHEVPTDIEGFNGICFAENVYWLTARNRCEIVIWDNNTDHTEILEVEKRQDSLEGVPFNPPLLIDKKLYLFPFWADNAYCIDVSKKRVEKVEELNRVFGSQDNMKETYSKMKSPAVIVDGKIVFVDEKETIWHIYDPNSRSLTDFEVQLNKNVWKEIKKRDCIKQFGQEVCERNSIPIYWEGEMFLFRDFYDFIYKYENELNILRTQYMFPKEKKGQNIYNQFAGR